MAEPAPLTPCPPWLLSHWHSVYERHEKEQLPHALLFSGAVGIGKKDFARFVSQSLLCRQPSREQGACGECDACAQLSAGSHADFTELVPEGAAMNIKVDSVRALVSWSQLSAPPGRYRIALIDSADAMNRNAANSLLKTLEEPGERAVLILAADKLASLPATVRSRCQQAILNVDDRQAALDYLRTHNIANAEQQLDDARVGPLAIVEQQNEDWLTAQALLQRAWTDLFLMRASVGKIVDSISTLSTARCLASFSNWTLLASKHQQAVAIGADPATVELISGTQHTLNSVQWFSLYDRIQSLYRSDSASFKTQAVLEGLFADIRLMTQG